MAGAVQDARATRIEDKGDCSPNAGPTRTAPTRACAGCVHDENYERLFAFPRMVEDLLRGFVDDEWVAEVDFSTLQKLSAEYIGDEQRRRHGDTVWRIRHREGWLHVQVLLEFQSSADPDMALRILEYTTLLYGSSGATSRWDRTASARRCCRWCSTTENRRGRRQSR